MLPDTVTRFRKEFERLEEQFRRCAGRHGRLEHEWICAWDSDEEVRLSEEQWQKFAEVNSENHVDDTSGWSCWDGPWEVTPSQNLFGRFFNDPSGFEEFLKLAEMGGAFLRCLDSTILKAGSGHSTWLYHLHRVGLLYPCSYLEVRVSIWNAAEDEQRAESELHSLWKDYDGIVIPTFPKVHSFEFDLFTTSAALCRVILERKFVSFWGDLAEDIPLLPFSDQSPMDGHQLVAEADVDMSATGCKNQWIFKNGWHYVSFEEDQLSAIPIEAHKGAEHILRLIEAEGDDIPCFRFEVGSRKSVGGGVRLASHSNEQVEGAISSSRETRAG